LQISDSKAITNQPSAISSTRERWFQLVTSEDKPAVPVPYNSEQ
jgi:hypothetical protein